MTSIPFNVNDDTVRETFLRKQLAESISRLDEQAPPLWGEMTPQRMVEHLLWAFECSTGRIELPCCTPEDMLEQVRKFLHDDRPMPRGFRNPLLVRGLPPLRFRSFNQAKAALQREVGLFLGLLREQPGAVHVHPLFGPLGPEEWGRAHFKHCYHHLMQFGMIYEPSTTSS